MSAPTGNQEFVWVQNMSLRRSILCSAAGLATIWALIGCMSDERSSMPAGTVLTSQLVGMGDVDRGRMLFYSKEATACAACHRFNGRGEHIGPDLTDVRRRLTTEQLHESIRDPNRTIANGYQVVMVVTTEKLIYGRLVSRTGKNIRLHLADEKMIEVPLGLVQEMKVLPSLMPIYTEEHLSDRDVRDIIAFLLMSEVSTPPTRVVASE